jgi:Flp pilus assembly protein TadD
MSLKTQMDRVVRAMFSTFVRGLAGVAVLGIGGCVISSPFDDQPGFASGQSGATSQFAGIANPSSALGTGTLGSAGSRFASSIRGVSDSVTSALTIEPKTISAADPLSLAGDAPAAGPELHVQAARVYEAQNNVGQALSHYESALLSSPSDATILTAIARLYDRNGDWVQAESYYLRASDADSESAGIYNDLALCYARQSKVDQAVATLGFAVQQDPGNPRFRNNLAAILIDARRFEEAYQQLASVHPEAVARYNAGFLMSKKGLVEPATNQLQLALQADPSFTPAQKVLDSLGGSGRTRAVFTSGSRSNTYGGQSDRSATMRRLPPV